MSWLTTLLTRVPLYPLLLAAYGVLYVYAENVTEVLPIDAVVPLGRGLIVAFTVLSFAALLFRDWRRAAIVTGVIVVGWSLFGLFEPGISGFGLDERAQLGLWAVAVAIAAVAATRLRGSLPTVTMLFNAFALVLIGLSLVRIVPYETARAARPSRAITDADAPIAIATRHPDRDVYLLVLDRYGSDWSIEQHFGLSNDLPEWLASQGFEVIPGARANYRGTDMSLASMLNMTMLDRLTEVVGRAADDRTPVRQMLQRTEVARFLRANGYRYYHLGSWWDFTATNALADEVLSDGEVTEFDLVLRDASVWPAIDRAAGKAPPEPSSTERMRSIARFQFRQLGRLAQVPGRKFVFAHILLPHPPYIFHADGSTVTRHESRTVPERELYAGHLAFANRNVREAVSVLLAGPDDSDPIIVITGDEGPLLCVTGDCMEDPAPPDDLGVRLGVLGAYHLPGLPADVLPPDHSSVNTFRVIFSEYFGADLPRLPDRSFNHPDNEHLYDYRDVTDMLPLPGG
jgi:hypothetical protein